MNYNTFRKKLMTYFHPIFGREIEIKYYKHNNTYEIEASVTVENITRSKVYLLQKIDNLWGMELTGSYFTNAIAGKYNYTELMALIINNSH